jgi:hypothetical protein
MSNAVDTKTKTTNPAGITSTGTTGTSPDSGGSTPPDPDPGPIKG